jgi:hypothetical protein
VHAWRADAAAGQGTLMHRLDLCPPLSHLLPRRRRADGDAIRPRNFGRQTRMSGKRLLPIPFRHVVSVLLPLIAAALCIAQALPLAGGASHRVIRAGQSTAGAGTVAQSVSANKAADAAAIVGDDWSSLYSKPSSPASKAASAIADPIAVATLQDGGSRRPLPVGEPHSAASPHAYFPQAPPASPTLA